MQAVRVREPGGPRLHEDRVRAVAGVEVRGEVVEHRVVARVARSTVAGARLTNTPLDVDGATSPTNVATFALRALEQARADSGPARRARRPRSRSSLSGDRATSARHRRRSPAGSPCEPTSTIRARHFVNEPLAQLRRAAASAAGAPTCEVLRHLAAQVAPVRGERVVGQIAEQRREVLAGLARERRGLRRQLAPPVHFASARSFDAPPFASAAASVASCARFSDLRIGERRQERRDLGRDLRDRPDPSSIQRRRWRSCAWVRNDDVCRYSSGDRRLLLPPRVARIVDPPSSAPSMRWRSAVSC